MSAELTFTDAEMEALKKCVSKAADTVVNDPDHWKPGEIDAALSAYQKLARGLNRPSRRRARVLP